VHEATRVHAWLIDGETLGQRFLADVWRMLGRLAKRCGGEVPSDGETEFREAHYLADLRGEHAIARLRFEAGVHRAQSIPDPGVGRVETSLVGVEILTGDSTVATGRPPVSVLKTYDYVHNKVTHHASGSRVSLEAVLEGEWDPKDQ
jgi:protein subunit release factor A